MEKMIAYCGLVCTECPAFIATQEDDQEALKQVADQWSKQFNMSLVAEDCTCDGCLSSTGRHCSYCRECKIRACGTEKKVRNCAHCRDYACQKLETFFGFAPAAKATLEKIRRVL